MGSTRQGRWAKNSRTWRQRRQHEEARWGPLIEPLTDAYLQWKYPIPPPHDQAPTAPADGGDTPMPIEWTIEQVFDLFTLTPHVTIIRDPASTSPAIDIMRNGYVAKTPEKPSAAVSIKTLELFHRIRQRKPSFSAEAMTKVICDYYLASTISVLTLSISNLISSDPLPRASS